MWHGTFQLLQIFLGNKIAIKNNGNPDVGAASGGSAGSRVIINLVVSNPLICYL